MVRLHGGNAAKAGVYFNRRQLAFASLPDNGVLPGTAADEYREIPAIAMLALGPMLGLAYAIFLPFIGLAMAVGTLMQKLAQPTLAALEAAARGLRPAWHPAMSFLSRARRARTGSEPAVHRDAWLEEVKAELRDDA